MLTVSLCKTTFSQDIELQGSEYINPAHIIASAMETCQNLMQKHNDRWLHPVKHRRLGDKHMVSIVTIPMHFIKELVIGIPAAFTKVSIHLNDNLESGGFKLLTDKLSDSCIFDINILKKLLGVNVQNTNRRRKRHTAESQTPWYVNSKKPSQIPWYMNS